MDPTRALADILDGFRRITDGETDCRTDVVYALEDLVEWLQTGGWSPNVDEAIHLARGGRK